MKQLRSQPWLLLFLLIAAALPLTACGSAPAAAAPPADTVSSAPVTSVQVATVEKGDIARIYNYTGNLNAADIVTIVPIVGGRIEKVLVEAGDALQKGDPIALVDSRIPEAKLKQAQAQLEVAKLNLQKMDDGARPEQLAAAQKSVNIARAALNDVYDVNDSERTAAVSQLAAAEVQLKMAQSEYDKISWAGQTGMTLPAIKLEQATIAYEAAKAAYDLKVNPGDAQTAQLKAQLTQAELQLALAEEPVTETDRQMVEKQIELAEAAVEMAAIQVDEATIRAPRAGTLAELYITEGQMVGPQVPAGKLVSDEIELVFKLEESRLPEVKVGQNAALRVSAWPDTDFPAIVTHVASTADAHSHTFAVTVAPLDEDNLLRSGMFAKLALLVDEHTGALLVPQSAIVKNADGQTMVYVTNADNQVEQRSVILGLTQDDRVEVLSGLEEGDWVVTVGQAKLEDGAKIEVLTMR